jgi:hypothetical protein
MKNKTIPTQQPCLQQHWHQLCLQAGNVHHLLQNVSIDTQYIGVIEEQNEKLNILRKNWLSSIALDIECCQQMQAGERMFHEH